MTRRYLALLGLALFAFLFVCVLHYASGMHRTRRAEKQAAGSSLLKEGKLEDDGNVKASILSCENNDFRIKLQLDISDADGKPLDARELKYEVMEDGKVVERKQFVTQTAEDQAKAVSPARVCLVMDYSASMGPMKKTNTKTEAARKAALALLDFLKSENDYLGLYFFNGRLQKDGEMERLQMGPLGPPDSAARKKARDLIQNTDLGGKTPMFACMEQAAEAMAKYPGKQVMIVLTDGKDTESKKKQAGHKEIVLKICKGQHIPVYYISFPMGRNRDDQMEEVVNETGGKHLEAAMPTDLKNADDVTNKFLAIGKSLQEQYYVVEYNSPNTSKNGEPRNVVVTVRAGDKGTQVKTKYDVPGVMSAGGNQQSTTAPSGEEEGSPPELVASSRPIGMILLALGSLLVLLFTVPYFTWLRGGHASSAEAASPGT